MLCKILFGEEAEDMDSVKVAFARLVEKLCVKGPGWCKLTFGLVTNDVRSFRVLLGIEWGETLGEHMLRSLKACSYTPCKSSGLAFMFTGESKQRDLVPLTISYEKIKFHLTGVIKGNNCHTVAMIRNEDDSFEVRDGQDTYAYPECNCV